VMTILETVAAATATIPLPKLVTERPAFVMRELRYMDHLLTTASVSVADCTRLLCGTVGTTERSTRLGIFCWSQGHCESVDPHMGDDVR
jgi:hypothetical protein